jgi:solute carrier family 25 protein 44
MTARNGQCFSIYISYSHLFFGFSFTSESDHSEGTDDTWTKFNDLNKSFFAASVALFSVFTSALTHPFTVIAVRQQVHGSILSDNFREMHMNRDVITILRKSWMSYGFQFLFKGWLPMAILGPPSNIVYFSLIESSREHIQPLIFAAAPSLKPEAVEVIQSGASALLANFVSLVPYVPAEVVSSRLIVHPKKVGMIDICKSIHRETGFLGFFKGFGPSFTVCTASSFFWWSSYSVLRRTGMHSEWIKDKPFVVESFSGLVAGLTAVTLSYPIDTVKTRIMASSSQVVPSFLTVMRTAVKNEGARSLFRGLPATLYQAALGSSVFAVFYESVKSASSKIT